MSFGNSDLAAYSDLNPRDRGQSLYPMSTVSDFISGAWFFFFIVYSYFDAVGLPISADFTGLVEIVGSSPAFYLLILLVPIVALTPDIVYKAVKTTVWPDIIDRARAKEQGKTIFYTF